MASLKQIKKRVKSIKNTRKVTKTMELLSGIKMQKSVDRALRIKEFRKELNKVTSQALAQVPEFKHTFTEPAEQAEEREAIIVICSDRGLCGSYNINVRKALMQYLRNREASHLSTHVFLAGKKLASSVKALDVNLSEVYKIGDFPDADDLADLLYQAVSSGFAAGSFSKVTLVFTQFESIGKQQVLAVPLLPFPAAQEEELDPNTSIKFESSEHEVLDFAIAEAVRINVKAALSAALASEHMSRMLAMKNATDAADDIVDTLSLVYNKTRQALITKEISEIVGGSLGSQPNEAEAVSRTHKIFINLHR